MMSQSKHPKAEDFLVGQLVTIKDASDFISSVCNYLRDRTGVVTAVWPSDTSRDSPIRRNQVKVKWGKRNGRGLEKEMIMNPRDLISAPCEDEGCPHYGTPHGHVERVVK